MSEMSPEATADILEHLTPDEAVHVSERLDSLTLAEILDETSPDVAADVLRNIPNEQSEETLAEMEEAEDVIPLLQYPDDTAGGLMSSDHMVVRRDITAGVALDSVRLQSDDAEHAEYVLAVDGEGRLAGSIGVARLALAPPSVPVAEIITTDIRSVTADTDQ